jgi:hypothetical protein
MLTKTQIADALKAALSAPYVPQSASGCGRAYVCVSGSREEIKAFADACKAQGVLFLKKAYGTSGNALYVGYDNADGRALARAEVIAAELKAHGLSAYSDAVAD